MDLSRILCSTHEQDELNVAELPEREEAAQHAQVSTEDKQNPGALYKDRKRSYRLSATQRQHRRDHRAYESRVFNLKLDINDLRQQIRFLTERRDLYTTRLLLHHQQIQSQILEMTYDLLFSYRGDAYGLAPSGRGCYVGSVLQFEMQRGRPAFSHRSFIIKSVRVLAMACDNDIAGEYASEIRQVCGARGGCIVEVSVTFTGRITRETLATMFPLVLRDQVLTSQLIGMTITFSARLLLYFDAGRRLIQQLMQAEIVAALNALHLAGMNDFAALAGFD